MYVSVVFVIRPLYSAVSLTLVREQRFIRDIYYYWMSCGFERCPARSLAVMLQRCLRTPTAWGRLG